jgi:hypothetical protein
VQPNKTTIHNFKNMNVDYISNMVAFKYTKYKVKCNNNTQNLTINKHNDKNTYLMGNMSPTSWV